MRITVRWEIAPFYRRMHWRNPLWSLWPVRWVVRVDDSPVERKDRFHTLDEAIQYVVNEFGP